MNKLKKFAASFFAVIMLCPVIHASAELSETQNNCPDFSQIKNITFDSDVFDHTVKKLNQIAESKNYIRSDEVKKLLETLIDQYIRMQTIVNIDSINYYANVTDSDLSQKYLDSQQLNGDIYNTLTQCCADLYSAGFTDELNDVYGYDLTEIFLVDSDENVSDEEYESIQKENNRLIKEINSIVNEYNSYTEEDFRVEYKNQTWILSDILNNPPEDDNDYEAISKLIHDRRNSTLGSLYLKLVRMRQQIAELYGFENYAEYAYERLYIKDYSTEDTDKIYSDVKKYFSKMSEDISDEAALSAYYSGIYDMEFSGEEVLNTVTPFFDQIDPEISERFDHLKKHNLFDINLSNTKSGDSFMNNLYEYSVPFVFITPQGDYNDIMTIIHEFGHANAGYAKPSSAVYDESGVSYDTSEMHSQGMEVLFTHYTEQLFGEEKGRAFNKIIISNLIDSVLQGCLFDEFQKYAYQNPNCTLDDLNAEYKKLCMEYGMEYSDDDPYTYDWVEFSHNYESPMYYISYAASAVSVLDLWLQSMNDMDRSVEIYKEIVECDIYSPYIETAEKCKLATIFDKDALSEIAYQTEYYFENDTIDSNHDTSDNADYQAYNSLSDNDSLPDNSSLSDNEQAGASIKSHYDKRYEQIEAFIYIVFIPLILASIAYFAGLIIAVLVIRRSDKKRKARQNNTTIPFE